MNKFAPKSKPEVQGFKPERKRPTSREGLSAEAAASRALAFVDTRPQTTAQRKLQALADQSPRGQRLAQLQAMANNSPCVKAQAQLRAMIDTSPRQVAQRKRMERLFGQPAQRQEEVDEEELQMQAAPGATQLQDLEDEELLQGNLAPVQRQGELVEELIQGKFATAQRRDLEDVEFLPGKVVTNETPMQRRGVEDAAENRTGMTDSLKGGLEQLSGMNLSGVRVHHNSAKPAKLNALAYAQGQDIHLGPGQEKHLPHEGWHVVQQMQGRVKPTMQAKGESINDDERLEHEADVMGAKAMRGRRSEKSTFGFPIQSTPYKDAEPTTQDIPNSASSRPKIAQPPIQAYRIARMPVPVTPALQDPKRPDDAYVQVTGLPAVSVVLVGDETEKMFEFPANRQVYQHPYKAWANLVAYSTPEGIERPLATSVTVPYYHYVSFNPYDMDVESHNYYVEEIELATVNPRDLSQLDPQTLRLYAQSLADTKAKPDLGNGKINVLITTGQRGDFHKFKWSIGSHERFHMILPIHETYSDSWCSEQLQKALTLDQLAPGRWAFVNSSIVLNQRAKHADPDRILLSGLEQSNLEKPLADLSMEDESVIGSWADGILEAGILYDCNALVSLFNSDYVMAWRQQRLESFAGNPDNAAEFAKLTSKLAETVRKKQVLFVWGSRTTGKQSYFDPEAAARETRHKTGKQLFRLLVESAKESSKLVVLAGDPMSDVNGDIDLSEIWNADIVNKRFDVSLSVGLDRIEQEALIYVMAESASRTTHIGMQSGAIEPHINNPNTNVFCVNENTKGGAGLKNVHKISVTRERRLGTDRENLYEPFNLSVLPSEIGELSRILMEKYGEAISFVGGLEKLLSEYGGALNSVEKDAFEEIIKVAKSGNKPLSLEPKMKGEERHRWRQSGLSPDNHMGVILRHLQRKWYKKWVEEKRAPKLMLAETNLQPEWKLLVLLAKASTAQVQHIIKQVNNVLVNPVRSKQTVYLDALSNYMELGKNSTKKNSGWWKVAEDHVGQGKMPPVGRARLKTYVELADAGYKYECAQLKDHDKSQNNYLKEWKENLERVKKAQIQVEAKSYDGGFLNQFLSNKQKKNLADKVPKDRAMKEYERQIIIAEARGSFSDHDLQILDELKQILDSL